MLSSRMVCEESLIILDKRKSNETRKEEEKLANDNSVQTSNKKKRPNKRRRRKMKQAITATAADENAENLVDKHANERYRDEGGSARSTVILGET